MNPMDLSTAAGGAIEQWQKTHVTACILSMDGSEVVCEIPDTSKFLRNNPLYISKFELTRGLTSNRWNRIGSALHNLYFKELACQKPRKP